MGHAQRPADGTGRRAGAIWAVSLPLLLVEISETIIHVTDTAFLGRVGTAELAAFALADMLFDTSIVPVIGLAEAMQIVVARRIGQRRTNLVTGTFLHGMLLILIVSTGIAVVLHLAAPVAGQALAEDPDVAVAVSQFLSIAAYGVIPTSLSLGFAALYVGLARTAVLAGATILLAGANCVLSYALILGELGQPRLGIEGAAWAFVGAESVMFVYLTVFTAIRGLIRRNRSLKGSAAAGPTFRPLLRLAPPVAMQGLLDGLRWLAFFVIVEQVSEEALAWSNIVYACFAVLLIPSYAIAESTHSLVSNAIGRGRTGDIGRLTVRATQVAYLVTAPLATVAVLAPQQVIAVFTDDQAAIAGAVPSLRIVAIATVLVVPAEVWLAAVAGTGATDIAFGIELVLTVVLLTCAYVSAIILGLSLAHVWASMGVAALVALALSRWRLATRRVRHLE